MNGEGLKTLFVFYIPKNPRTRACGLFSWVDLSIIKGWSCDKDVKYGGGDLTPLIVPSLS